MSFFIGLALFFIISHAVVVRVAIREVKKNTASYYRSNDPTFLRIRRSNLAIIAWSTFWITFNIFWIMSLTHVI
jgi:hypothetical protein